MKKYFYLMSLMVGLLVCSFSFMACGDDDDDKGSTTPGGGGSGTTTATVDAEKLIGLWYGIDENSESRINVFSINFMAKGVGVYSEFKAKAKNNWEPEAEAAQMTWQLDNNTVKFIVTIPEKGTQERKADILKLTDNEVTIKRYLEEGTDEMTLKRAQNEQEVAMVLAQLIEGKIVHNSDAVTDEDLVGTWTVNSTNNSYVVIFTDNEVIFEENDSVTFRGEYSLNDGVVTIPMGEGAEFRSVPGLLYDKSVMVVKEVYKNDRGEEEMLSFVLFKQGKTVTATSDDIQGFWCWYSEFGEEKIIRTAIKIDGDRFELIITPWGERYVGTYTYQAGILHLNVTDGFTSREEHTGYGELWGRMDPQTLECDDWRVLDREYWHADAVSENPFIANGDEAYGFIANIPCILKKKK